MQPPGYLQRIIKGHADSVKGTLIHEDQIISWSSDRTLRIWDITSGNSLRVFEGHSSSVKGALIHEDKIISWSDDSTLGIWDITSGNSLHVLEGHSSFVKGTLIYEEKIISWSSDGFVIVWNVCNGKVFKKINYGFPIKLVQVQEKLLFVTDSYGKIIIHELDGYSLITSYYADAAITTLHIIKQKQRIIAIDESGEMHFLQPVAFQI